MLKFSQRFHGYGSLRFVYKNSKVTRSHFFTIKSVKNTRRKNTRVSIVVSKKILKSAVGRNRIRRRMYELVRQEYPHIPMQHDIVFIIISSELRTIDHEMLREHFIEQLRNADLYQ